MADLSITAANVSAGPKATIDTGTAGATITAGQTLYKDLTDSSRLKLADQDAAATAVLAGIALHGAASGQPVDYIKRGKLNLNSGVTIGRFYCVSSTAGGIGTSTDVTAGKYATYVGVGTATSSIEVAIQVSGVARA